MSEHPIKIFYHIYASTGSWQPIVHDQMTKLLYSGLLMECTACFVTIVGPDYDECRKYVITYPNVFIRVVPSDDSYERLTLLSIHHHIKPEDFILYIHSKGVTKYDLDIVRDWRNLMEWCLIKNYKMCLDLLQNHDVVGINRHPDPVPHFSGNFWWTKGSHYMKLPDTIGSEYTDPEMYIMSIDCWTYSLFESGVNHYTETYPLLRYVKEKLPSRGGMTNHEVLKGNTW